MKFSTLTVTVLCALVSSALGKANAAMAKQAAHIDDTSKHLKPGKYRFVNVASHKGLKYVKNGQSLYAAKGKGDWISIKTHHAHVVISPSNSNNKCVSAAWSYDKGANAYAALYKCTVANFKRDGSWTPDMETRSVATKVVDFGAADVAKRSNDSKLEKRVALREAKQYFYVHPAAKKYTYHIVAYDHITDQKATAVSDCVVSPKWAKKAKWACLVKLNDKDKHQQWYIYNTKGKRV